MERPLDVVEIRVLGGLLEKQQVTPESYPLTLNALRAACNQTTNRDPVMELTETEIQDALDRLQELGLVWRVHGGRVLRWDHKLDTRWNLEPRTKALLTLLMLRGHHTPGELRTRSERLFPFENVEHAESGLHEMAAGDEPLVEALPRRPGQKEQRWRHLLGARDEIEPARNVDVAESLSSRVERLESEVEALRSVLDDLRRQLGE